MPDARLRALIALAGLAVLAPSLATQDEPTEPAVTRRAVVFRDGHTQLAGTLVQPRADPAWAGVVILGGAERGPRTALKERMATALATRGLAALIYDSPGTGESGGNALLQPRAARAAEAIAAVRFVQAQAGIPSNRVGVFGTSEGANIALLAAADCRAIAFAVAASGMFCMSPFETARYRIEMQGAERGLSLEDVQKALLFEEVLFAMVAGLELVEWPLLATKAARWPAEPWPQLMACVRGSRKEMSKAEGAQLIESLGRAIGSWRHTPWFAVAVPQPEKLDGILAAPPETVLAYLRQNPLAAGDWYASWHEYGRLVDIHCPVLAVWGSEDSFVPPTRSAAALRASLGAAKDHDVTIEIVPGASHVFTAGGTAGAFVAGYPGLLVDWLRARLR